MNKRVYNAFRKAHFLPEEAKVFASNIRITPEGRRRRVGALPLNLPYVKEMLRERARAFRLGVKDGLIKSQHDWRETILEGIYTDLDLLNDYGEIDPWKLLRRAEEKYKDRHPEYHSPYKAKKKKSHFVSKYAKGLEAYDKGRGR